MKDEPRHSDRCFFCGEVIDLDAGDVVQIHAGANGLAHESCWKEQELLEEA